MLQSIARFLLRLGGWTLVGEVPTVPKAVFIVAPHTSNWDGIWGLIAKVAFDVDVRFFGKESLFWFPLGVLLRGMGGIPLDRSRAGGTVTQAIEAFAAEERLNIAMAPEGTRSFREHWKSGFYRIAVGAGVPLALAFFDYRNRRIGLGPTLHLTGRPDEDMQAIRDFYVNNASGRHPEKVGPVALPPEF